MINQRERLLRPQSEIAEPDFAAAIHTYASIYDLSLTVSEADGRDSDTGETIVNFLPWSEYVTRPDASDRYRVMAQTLGSRVLSLDNLGVGDGTSEIPDYLRRPIQRGDFDAVSRLQWEAVNKHNSEPVGNISLFGYSLGSAMAASFAKTAPEGVHIDRMFLWETVGSRRQAWPLMAAKFGMEALKWQQYFSENPDWLQQPGNDPTFMRRIRTNAAGYTDYPRGLTHGKVASDLMTAREREIIDRDTEIIIMNGTNSRISSPRDNADLVASLVANGMTPKVWEQYVGDSHGMIDSSMRVSQALQQYR